MSAVYSRILNPLGAVRLLAHPTAERKAFRAKPVVGLLDNSKPNAAVFLEALALELRRTGHYDVMSSAKARSAAPSAELDALAARCDFVVNAVAD
jgi:hypothetical protein